MTDPATLTQIQEGIRRMQADADRMQQLGAELPALKANLARIQASLKMLEINFCEIPDSAPAHGASQ